MVLVVINALLKRAIFVASVASRIAIPEVPPLVMTAAEVIEVRPAMVVAVPPRAIPVEPTVIELFASCAFGIALVPNSPVELL